MRYSCLHRHGGRDNGRPSMVIGSVHSLMFIAWHFETAYPPHKRESKILVPFCPFAPYGSVVSFIRKGEEERRKKITIFEN